MNESKNVLSDVQAIRRKVHDTERQKYQKQMRMMMAAMRNIQAPVTELCGLRGIDIPEDTPIYHYASIMNSCGVLLANMIENMKLYYLVSSGLYDERLTNFVLRSEIQNVWESELEDFMTELNLMGNIHIGQIEYSLNMDGSVPAGIVHGDPTILVKTIGNILSNALRFTSTGSVELRVYAVKSSDPPGMMLYVKVQDTGIGVPEASKDAIFDPLVKAHNDSVPGGVGMGLSVARAMARSVHGDVLLSDTGPGGSTFDAHLFFNYGAALDRCHDLSKRTTIDLSKDSKVSSALELAMPKGFGPKILIVEDIKLNRKIVSNILRRFDMIIEEACDGKVAVEMCSKVKYDLILMDIEMPVMSGLEASRIIRAGTINSTSAILALTGSRPGEISFVCKEAGIDDCITKPVQTKMLVDLIAKHVGPKGAYILDKLKQIQNIQN